MNNYFESALQSCVKRNDLLSREILLLRKKIKELEETIEVIIEDELLDKSTIDNLKRIINYKPKDNSY